MPTYIDIHDLPGVTPEEIAKAHVADLLVQGKHGVEYLDHDEFFSTSDIVTVHLKLSDRSIGYISAPEFAMMKPTALFVNTSRGPVVDESALVEALTRGRIAGAAPTHRRSRMRSSSSSVARRQARTRASNWAATSGLVT